ncbi:ribosomal RNA small subunit methyltransferase H [Aerococcus urinaehominis]|uniref:Ribosomal RNA small subunit methyltransferase H n=1 Tax=Aerococcus urinaehominis TaxID=128944 RepID=A0A120IB00_9LACT|nr:16S rRNA (cytosine(1402)-N(4))-methyltransferase RsmH [Aerococcus urinaehominis]AMB99656.1 ribosomal RNA small subunit methyltransferase H [Aerococcus urinaehominis]SDL89184.1 16S rRNA (cytosine1402-N4)-methyltransferase [Aerococcus urinaehominis]
MTQEFNHITVLLDESIDQLHIKPNGVYVDCTLGGGGHTAKILAKLDQGRLYAFDQDQVAIDNAQLRFKDELAEGKLVLIHRNFSQVQAALAEYGVSQVDGLLYDLGVSSPQLDQAERGFSYNKQAPLDMRMDQSQALTAYQVLNEWSYEDLVRIFFRYGEEKFSKQVARKIEKARAIHPISDTLELVDLIKEAIPAPARRKGGHPAKRVFQAIRIAVNDELGVVEQSLDQALKLLKSGGRIAVISFHSLEDRIVKQMFKQASTPPELPKNLPVPAQDLQAEFNLVTRKPIYPSPEELAVNKRAQSAKLRVIEKK